MSPTVTKTEWLIYSLLVGIPLVNLVALIYFACDREKPSRANLARLQLIILGILCGIFFLLGLLL